MDRTVSNNFHAESVQTAKLKSKAIVDQV
jgi:hypothetical protein